MGYVLPGSEPPARATLRVGDWIVHPLTDQITRDGTTIRVEARTMRLLLCLVDRAGEVVSIDDLLSEVWAGVIVTPDSVYQAVTSLRRLLGDDSRQPAYIATVPRRGYRLIAAVGAPLDPVASATDEAAASMVSPAPSREGAPKAERHSLARHAWVWVGVLLLAGVGLTVLFHPPRASIDGQASTSSAPHAKSIAVLPFADLTDAMNEEPFADGMTEELIDKLSKFPGVQVSAPTSSFYYKNRQVPLSDIARSLGVAYILDGSVRTSGTTMRVAARLVHAKDGFVVWSATYDRPLGDKLMVQDEIATSAANALTPAIK